MKIKEDKALIEIGVSKLTIENKLLYYKINYLLICNV